MPPKDSLPDALRDPGAFERSTTNVDFIETHISWLFLTDDRVYKVKKPVDLGFLDFSTVERRKHFCEEEVRLNRRLTPWMYHGVARVFRTRDGLRVEDIEAESDAAHDEDAVGWAVVMDRLPADGMLAKRLADNAVNDDDIDRLAEILTHFHGDCATGEGIDEFGDPSHLRRNAVENFDTLDEHRVDRDLDESGARVVDPVILAFLRDRALDFLDEHAALLERRLTDRRIREGHGDLHAGNICFTPRGIAIYDCIEFTRRFRCADVAGELGFLTMDLDTRGHPEIARRALDDYVRHSGDEDIRRLIDYYRGYAAIVRGKVNAITASDEGIPQDKRAAARQDAHRYLRAAAGYALAPTCVLTCGLPASGKSVLGRRVGTSMHATIVRSDVVRKELAGVSMDRNPGRSFEAGLYSAERSEQTYAALLERARAAWQDGRHVVVDAMFGHRAERARFIDAASADGVPCIIAHVTCPEDVIRERMAKRDADASEVSDADFAVYRAARDRFESPDTEGAESRERDRTITVDSAGDDAEMAADRVVAGLIRARG